MAAKRLYYVLIVWDDTEPELIGPYALPENRDEKARRLKAKYSDEHGIFKLDLVDGKLAVKWYSRGDIAVYLDED